MANISVLRPSKAKSSIDSILCYSNCLFWSILLMIAMSAPLTKLKILPFWTFLATTLILLRSLVNSMTLIILYYSSYPSTLIVITSESRCLKNANLLSRHISRNVTSSMLAPEYLTLSDF